MTKIVKRLALLMLMLPFVACEETNYETDEFVGKKTISQLSTDNFLTFDSFEELEKKVEEISQMTYEEQVKEEESNNFVSIDRIYEEITLAEEELLKPYENLTEEELSKMPRKTSATHDMYSDILITDTLEDGCLIELPNALPKYTKVLNRKSIVKVAGKIYQFKRNEIKIIEDGDVRKIPYLDAISISDLVLNITVVNKKDTEVVKDVIKTAYKTNGTFRVQLKNNFLQVKYGADIYTTSFFTEIKVMKKAFGLFYIPHRNADIYHTWSFAGNKVLGYRINNYGNNVMETHSWNRNETEEFSGIYEVFYGHEAAITANISGYNRYTHYHNEANTPVINGGIKNHIRVKCSRNRTIEFDMNY